ncbi:cation diffusion facilitator family transporter [Marinospirillum alkaliphilum]|uniref:Cation diffusion facilitator family transporter n=1 Tax=Marinospirillum alkaliphilum DSM 21637 TaxID=1122209 RepID=A0A1K1TJL5_9GAMM|nr:cation diffusion facilitator family transporter [Marinospirillum alkaliphilum]SFX00752.1 cation diffusion facilitator family transporter [Marinospirillum alkaliphilum DSM 21637]
MSSIQDVETRAAHKVTLIGMVVNALNAIAKILVGFWANSAALVADGIHSLSDLLSDFLVLGATHFGRQKPDQDHPYGHDRYETLATLLLGAILIAVAGALVWDSLTRLLHAGELMTPGAIALLVAVASILSKEWIYRYTLRIARKINSKLLEANAWHHRTDSLSSIVVFVGIGGALLGFPWLDQLAAVIVGIMVARIGIKLIWNSLKELVDTALPDEETQKIREIARSVPGVRDVHHLRTRTMGSRSLLDIHLQVAPYASVSEGHEIGVWVARQLRDEFEHISDVTFHIDPEDDAETDNPDPARMLPLRPEVLNNLHQRWVGDPDYERPHHTTLHYLNLGIDVDLFYSADQVQPEQISALETRLLEKASDLPWLKKVRVWIGKPNTE